MLISVLFSCQSSTLESGGVEEILPGSNASIIRNPVEANQPLDSNAIASIQFDQTIFDFGEVMEGVLVEHTFSFANKGKVPLLITDARSTCGCTVPEWPRQPIPPGQVAEISVRFDTKQKFNQQNKPVTITANTLPAQTTIYLRGFVKAQQ
ncbi:MAG: DUF1573 domain-containing protein [Saprospiraceae bacterium]|nr:DUF1573 domain-containing protein [Saprospiraceae bacterium]